MAGNVSSDAAIGRSATNHDEGTRGRPYYEKLRSDLRACIDKKLKNDRQLAAIEADIAQTEEEYLESTSAAGNIIKGFDNYIKASSSTGATASGPGTATRRKGGVMDQDRIFSKSSVSWTLPDTEPLNPSSGNARSKGADSAPLAGGGSGSGSARDTPTGSIAGTTKGASKNKKKGSQGKLQDEEEDAERPAKRNKISWGRE